MRERAGQVADLVASAVGRDLDRRAAVSELGGRLAKPAQTPDDRGRQGDAEQSA